MNRERQTRFLAALLVLAATAGPAWSQGSTSGPPMSMDEYVRQVLASNPRLLASQSAVDASREQIPQAGSLPDPMVGLSLMNFPWDSFRFDQEPMTMKQITLSQAFPAPGVLNARTRLAREGERVAGTRLVGVRERLIREARLAYLDLYFVDRSLEVVTMNQSLLAQLIQAAEARYRTGRGIQQDVLKAQLELSRLSERQITLEEQRAGTLSRLNALRSMPAGSPVPSAMLPEMQAVAPTDSLVDRAEAANPDLATSQAMVERQRAVVELAHRLRLPGWAASTAYSQRDADRADLLTLMVSVQIPLYAGRKQAKAVDEQLARLNEARYDLEDRRLSIRSSVERLASDLNRARRLLELYESQIIPQAEGVLNSTLSGYQVEDVDFLTLLSAQTTLFNYQLEAARAATDFQRRVADLEAIVGAPLDLSTIEP